MKVSELMEAMSAAGAPMEAILIAVRALEGRDEALEQKRSVERERKRRQRARDRDMDGTVTGQSRDDTGTVLGTVTDEPSLPRLPNENNSNPSTPTHPDRNTPPAREDGEPAEPASGKAPKGKPVVPDWIPAKPWNGYLEMRKRIGKAPTDRAIELMIGKLERWRAAGHDPGTILDEATEHNWTGLYEPKEPRNATRPQGSPDAWRNSAGARPLDNRDGFRRELEERALGGQGHG